MKIAKGKLLITGAVLLVLISGTALILKKQALPEPGDVAASEITVPPEDETIPEITAPLEVRPPYTREEILAEMDSADKNWLNLPMEQYLADFVFLYEQLQENYPYMGVAERLTGKDFDLLYQQYYGDLSLCDNDYDAYALLNNFIGEFEGVGHLRFLATEYFDQVALWQNFYLTDIHEKQKNKDLTYLSYLKNPDSIRFYQLYREFFNGIDNAVALANSTINIPDYYLPYTSYSSSDNAITEIWEEDRIAYIRINAFNGSRLDTDWAILLPFYEEVWDYPHLVIDITGNPGGSMQYFDDLIAGPLIGEALSVPVYYFAKGSSNNDHFLNFQDETIWQPIAALPELANANASDMAELDYFSEVRYTVQPREPESGFQGKIWLLVNEKVYSSSEYAAMMTKSTGFATLVGRTTGGDGIGVDPVYLRLPNSGLILRYSAIYGTTADGASSEEFGTVPDIITPPGGTAIKTVLAAIETYEEIE